MKIETRNVIMYVNANKTSVLKMQNFSQNNVSTRKLNLYAFFNWNKILESWTKENHQMWSK